MPLQEIRKIQELCLKIRLKTDKKLAKKCLYFPEFLVIIIDGLFLKGVN